MCKKRHNQIFEAEQEHTVFVIDPVNFHQEKHIGTHLHTQQAFNCSFCSLAFIQPQQQCRETAILDGCEMLIPMEKEHFKQFVPGPEAAFVLHCLKSDDSEEKCKNE